MDVSLAGLLVCLVRRGSGISVRIWVQHLFNPKPSTEFMPRRLYRICRRSVPLRFLIRSTSKPPSQLKPSALSVLGFREPLKGLGFREPLGFSGLGFREPLGF